MVEKKFFKAAEDMKEVAPDYGACFATDLITVDGHPVGFMYREDPDNEIDSGWRFLAGFESEEYMDDDANMGIYDVKDGRPNPKGAAGYPDTDLPRGRGHLRHGRAVHRRVAFVPH